MDKGQRGSSPILGIRATGGYIDLFPNPFQSIAERPFSSVGNFTLERTSDRKSPFELNGGRKAQFSMEVFSLARKTFN